MRLLILLNVCSMCVEYMLDMWLTCVRCKQHYMSLVCTVYTINKNSLGLLKKGAAKQSRIKSIEALVRARAQPVATYVDW